MRKLKWIRILNIIGIIILIAGIIDPLEGSFIILAGSAIVSITAFFAHDRHWKIFLATFIMIIFGVFFLFYFSSLGGFGGKSAISWWWSALILPYPIGWLCNIILLIVRAIQNNKKWIAWSLLISTVTINFSFFPCIIVQGRITCTKQNSDNERSPFLYQIGWWPCSMPVMPSIL